MYLIFNHSEKSKISQEDLTMSGSAAKVNRPKGDNFRQQKMASWQPIMTPFHVVMAFVAVGIIFIPIGKTLMNMSDDIYESKINYDPDLVNNQDCSISEQNEAKNCIINFQFDKDVKGPVYVYYELTNFYQNHRKYVTSQSPSQLQGTQEDENAIKTSCDTMAYAGTGEEGKLLNPCGLIANSFFTDIITLTSSTPEGLNVSSDNIAWESDKDKFIQVDGFESCESSKPINLCECDDGSKIHADCIRHTEMVNGVNTSYIFYYPDADTYQYLYETYPKQISPIKGVTDQHFMVWMRTASMPTFRKLYGKIDSDFKAGDKLTFNVEANFEVNSFDGTKALVISTNNAFGGKNPYLGFTYIIVGCLSLLLGLLFFTKSLLSPRPLGNIEYLTFDK